MCESVACTECCVNPSSQATSSSHVKHLFERSARTIVYSVTGAFTVFHSLLVCVCCTCRPEADDVKALKQELTTLHVLLEETTGEQEKQLSLVSSGRTKAETEVEQ